MEVAEIDYLVDSSNPDEDLFWAMSLKEENEKEAQNAYAIFYERYGSTLWSLCIGVCSQFNFSNIDELVKEVFSITAIKIYRTPTYDSSKGKLTTWMSTIAKHELINILRKAGKEPILLDSDHSNVADDSYLDDEEERVFPEKEILLEALKALSERERHILMTYMLYSDGRKHLPDGVLQELINEYDTTADNIKHIKSRAFAKIKTYIRQNSNLLS